MLIRSISTCVASVQQATSGCFGRLTHPTPPIVATIPGFLISPWSLNARCVQTRYHLHVLVGYNTVNRHPLKRSSRYHTRVNTKNTCFYLGVLVLLLDHCSVLQTADMYHPGMHPGQTVAVSRPCTAPRHLKRYAASLTPAEEFTASSALRTMTFLSCVDVIEGPRDKSK